MTSVLLGLVLATPCTGLGEVEKLLFTGNMGLSIPAADADRDLLAVRGVWDAELVSLTGTDVQTGQERIVQVLVQGADVLAADGSAIRRMEIVSAFRDPRDRLVAGQRYLLAGCPSAGNSGLLLGTSLRISRSGSFFCPAWGCPSESGGFIDASDSFSSEFRTLATILGRAEGALNQWLFSSMPAPREWMDGESVSKLGHIRQLEGDAGWLYDYAMTLDLKQRLPILTWLVHWEFDGVQAAYLDALIKSDSAGEVQNYLLNKNIDLRFADKLPFVSTPDRFSVDRINMVSLATDARKPEVKRVLLDQVKRLEEENVVPTIRLLDVADQRLMTKAADLLAVFHHEPDKRPGRVPKDRLAEKLAEWRLYWRNRYGLGS